jgi:hypothetical protein
MSSELQKDPVGEPDFTLPVSIVALEIPSLAVDIKSESIGNLKVDLAAQSITAVGVDIKSQSVGNLNVNIAAQSLPTLGIDIKAQTIGNLNVNIAAQSVDVKITNAVDGSGNPIPLKIDISAQSIGNLGVDIKAQSVGNLGIDIKAQSVGNIKIDLAAQSIDIKITNAVDAAGNPVPLKIDIAAQSVGNLGVDIKAQSVGNLKVDLASQSVGNLAVDIKAQSVGNLNVNLASQSATINVANYDATMKIIDFDLNEWSTSGNVTRVGYGYVRVAQPSSGSDAHIISKKGVLYGIWSCERLTVGTKLVSGVLIFWGFGHVYSNNCVAFFLSNTYAYARCRSNGATTDVDITSSFPTNTDTTSHLFRINWTKGKAEFIIDGKVVATITTNVPDLPCYIIFANVSNTGTAITSNVDGCVFSATSQGGLAVTINAQAQDVTVNISAQNVGVYLEPQWAAKQGTDVNATACIQITTTGVNEQQVFSYTVPSGKTLLIHGLGGYGDNGPANPFGLYIYDFTAGVRLATIGGAGGCSISFAKPLSAAAGHQVAVYVRANVGATPFVVCATFWGELI